MFRSLLALVAFACVSQPLHAQSAPPAIGPPPAAQEPDEEFYIFLWRVALEAAVSGVFRDARALAEAEGYTLEWPDSYHPGSCGNNCVRSVRMRSTEYLDQPNQRYAYVEGTLAFDGSRFGLSRRLYIPVELRAICERGGLRLVTTTGTPYLGSGNVLEDILDFLLLPLNLSARIEAEVRKELESLPQVTETMRMQPCRTLSVVNDEDWRFDRIVWDSPPRFSTPGLAPAENSVSLSVKRITRANLSPVLDDGKEEIGFYFYVNGQQLEAPLEVGHYQLGPGESVMPQGLDWELNLNSGASLQIIVTDDDGNSGWAEHTVGSSLDDTRQNVQTSRIVFRPPTPPATRPSRINVHQYSVEYEIEVQRLNIVQPF